MDTRRKSLLLIDCNCLHSPITNCIPMIIGRVLNTPPRCTTAHYIITASTTSTIAPLLERKKGENAAQEDQERKWKKKKENSFHIVFLEHILLKIHFRWNFMSYGKLFLKFLFWKFYFENIFHTFQNVLEILF